MIPFDPKRVAVVELPKSRSRHLLIRGNLPLVGDDFAYPEIEKSLNLDFSSDRFLCVSFLDNTGEREPWSAEMKSFRADPNLFPKEEWPPYERKPSWDPRKLLGSGELVYGKSFLRGDANLIWWPFEGMSPQDAPDTFLRAPGWDFGGAVEYLYDLYTDPTSPPTVIYMHCMLGADRTGAMHASLLMRAGMKFAEALSAVSRATSAGTPNEDYVRLVKAYSESLSSRSSL